MKTFLVWRFLRSCIIVDMFKYWDDLIRKNEMGGTCGTYGGGVSCIEGLVGKPEGKRPLVKPRRGWEDNININFQDMVWEMWSALIWLSIGASGRQL